MRTNCFGHTKLTGRWRPAAFVGIFLFFSALAVAFLARGQSQESSTPASNSASSPAAGQSGASAADQGDDLFPSIGDQLGSYVPEKPQEPVVAGQPAKGQEIVPQRATVQTLTALGAGTPAAASTAQPATAQPATAPPNPVAAAPEPEIVDVPVAHAGDQHRQQINNECANLLKMANALKVQVDKTTKDQLSVSVIRQANQIEQLARKVRDEMKPGVVSKN